MSRNNDMEVNHVGVELDSQSLTGAPVPLLILSDSVAGHTGLGRIARDLAMNIHAGMKDEFRVGVLGVGGPIASSSRFSFFNCSVQHLDRMVPLDLPLVWKDFAGTYGDILQNDAEADQSRIGMSRKGVLLAIWNASWCRWLAEPQSLPDGHPLKGFLLSRPFEKWMYCPVDGNVSDETLGCELAPIILGMDRLLAYSRYGSRIIRNTLVKWSGAIDCQDVPHLPHGIDTDVFKPRDRKEARLTFLSRVSNGTRAFPLLDSQVILAANATNTSRKDWALAFATCEELLRRGRNVFLWGHTDRLDGHWNLRAMATQYGVNERVVLTTEHLSDETLAWAYSAADVGLHIGGGEGFGYFGPEANACGLPVVHGDYAGGAEFVEPEGLVEAVGYYTEGRYLIQRPVFRVTDWADRVEELMLKGRARLARPLGWHGENGIWPHWKQWLEEGIR